MNLEKAYLAMFCLLDGYYDETKDDVLAGLLSSLDPYLFEGTMSADPAAWIDWKECIQESFNKENLSTKEAFQAVILFLDFYQKEFGFDLNWILNDLKNNQSIEKWEDIVQKVISTE